MKKLALIAASILGGCATTSTTSTKATTTPFAGAVVKYDEFDQVWRHRSGTWRLHSTETMLKSKNVYTAKHTVQVPWDYFKEVFSNPETKGFKLRATGRSDLVNVIVLREQYEQILLQLAGRNK
ncbi:hypothetical protein [Vibrio variabilis]|uniref:hypothetical protein n=1 Tax=Vibrio variabilis TaxID=990271 RepID=UPI000DDA423C|nr:hypothetical protein [Vibrio variabilis]